jgi:hypothetical protein
MNHINKSERYALGIRTVRRVGYGAMQLAGPGATPMQAALAWLLR